MIECMGNTGKRLYTAKYSNRLPYRSLGQCAVLKHLGIKTSLIRQSTDVGKRTSAVVFAQLFADVLVLGTITNRLPVDKPNYYHHHQKKKKKKKSV
jgi:hypothetical protein